MNYVSSIKTSARCGSVTELGPRTLLLGANGTGKTAIVNGIEIGASQFATDVEGRLAVKQGAMLGRLGATDNRPLRSELVFAGGQRAEFLLKANPKGGFHRPEVTEAEGITVAFPVLEVRKVLAMTPEAIRRWLLGKVGQGISREKIVSLLDAEYVDEYLDLVKTYDTSTKKTKKDEEDDDLFSALSEVEKFLAVVKDAESKAKALVKEADRANSTLDAVLGDVDTIPDESTIEALAAGLKEMQSKLMAQMHTAPAPRITLPAEPMRGHHDRHLIQMEDTQLLAHRNGIVQAIEGQEAEIQRIRVAYQNLPAPSQDAEIALAFVTAIEQAAPFVQGDSLTCPLCSSRAKVTQVKERKTQWEAFCRDAAQQRQARTQMEQRFASIQAHQKTNKDALPLIEAEIAFRQKHAAWKAECIRIGQATIQTTVTDTSGIADLQHDITQKTIELGHARERAAQWARNKGEMARIKREKKKAQALNDLATQGEEVVMKLLKGAQAAFVTRVQQFLPERYRFGLALFDKKKNPICRMGFVRGGELHTALSGAEMVCLTLALAAAVQPESPNLVSIFVPEERGLAPETLTVLMESLHAIPGQVILQSPVPPTRVPDGWVVVLAAEAAAKAATEGYGP